MSARPAVEGVWPAQPESVPATRRFVRDYLRELGRSDLADDAELVVTELVSNVVLHVGGSVRVAACADDDDLVLEVSDESHVAPQVRSFSATSSTGRGMRLIHSLSVEHGIRLADGGKTIWVRLTTATAGRSDADAADAFADVDWLAQVADLPDVDGRATSRTGTVLLGRAA